MKKQVCSLIFLLIFPLFLFTSPVGAEDKSGLPAGRIIPKISSTPDGPELVNGHVYPEWGPVCQRYTYSVVYKDKEGRPPEYVQIYFNGEMIDMEKTDPDNDDYQTGVRYEYQFVPTKIDSNFYYFEASNGLGKVRESIIDSPDNGPVLFASAFDSNEIVLIDSTTGAEVWRYDTGTEWVGGVALSADGQYLAALTDYHVYLFSIDNNQPLWQYQFDLSSPIAGGPRGGGIAISDDGNQIVAAAGTEIALFNRDSNQPQWKYEGIGLTVAISADGQYLAAGMIRQNQTVEQKSNVLFLWRKDSNQPLMEFESDGNFHDVSLSADGQYLAASTGCPDRKAYLFFQANPVPLFQSEQLTLDSPVSKAQISADGSLAAFATEGGQNSNVAVLFSKDSSEALWEFSDQKLISSRALGLTPDGRFIGVATMKGDVYLLGRNSNQPIKTWQTDSSVGALDIADDASFIALGGSDNQVWILPTGSDEIKKIPTTEFIQALDIAGNGKLIAVGTGGSVYFYEAYVSPGKDEVFQCQEVIEPPTESSGELAISNNRPRSDFNLKTSKLPGMVFGFGFLGSVVVLVVYLAVTKFNLLPKVKLKMGWNFNRRVVIAVGSIGLIFLALTIAAMAVNIDNNQAAENQESLIKEPESNCGNTVCEPKLGETQENCPQDCSTTQ